MDFSIKFKTKDKCVLTVVEVHTENGPFDQVPKVKKVVITVIGNCTAIISTKTSRKYVR